MAETNTQFSKVDLEFVYEADYLQTMFQREKFRQVAYGQSPQISHRPHLITELARISEDLRLSSTTVHLAVYLLDRFMDQHNIASHQLMLALTGSISIAAKFEEHDPSIPRISEINAFNKAPYLLCECLSMEIVMLTFFDWYVGFPTAAHYLFYYLSPSFWKKSPWFQHPSLTITASHSYFKERAQHYLDSTIHDYRLVNTLPSHLAAACLAATRIELNLEPVWPEVFQQSTRYKFRDLISLVNIIMKRTDVELLYPVLGKRGYSSVRVHSPDSAYESSLDLSPYPYGEKREKKSRKKTRYC